MPDNIKIILIGISIAIIPITLIILLTYRIILAIKLQRKRKK